MIQGKGLLTPIQKAFLAVFSRIPDQERFYLTGGTALSEYYLGHRLSFDLDLFTGVGDLILPFSYQLEKMGPENGLAINVIRRFNTFVELVVAKGEDNVKIDLALDSPFRLESPVLSETGVYLNDYRDVSADKMLAFFGRAEPRDAVDLYFMMQLESIWDLCDLAKQKDTGFDLYWFAIALNRTASFPDELERWPVKMLVPFKPVEAKQTFQKLALDIMSSLTSSP